jgi:hypothetical protein
VKQSQNLIEHHATLVRLNAIRGPILEGKANMAETVAQRNRLYAVSQQLGDTLVQKPITYLVNLSLAIYL